MVERSKLARSPNEGTGRSRAGANPVSFSTPLGPRLRGDDEFLVREKYELYRAVA
jgi:hypothetical protein